MAFDQEWVPKTRLGKLVVEGQVASMDEAIKSGLPIREPQIIDMLLPDLEDEVLDINMVQRMTDSGRRVKFRATVIVGNRNGYVGLGQAKDVQVGPAIRKAIDAAKLNITYIRRGCGSWECACGLPHTVPYEVTGKAGSVSVTLIPAPRGLGIAAGNTATKVLEKAGIKDVWTKTFGTTRTTLNFAKATYDALNKVNIVRLPVYYGKEEV
ncbi:30S ribosomal protein S5 [Methanosarcina sp. 2.H.T.1A.6]|uniref:30S ribosomal protein S5 n=1 Tax=unclassified Methanosarcina TaxID=2644672 RepID=UPI000620F883|nr:MULTISPECIES: 30S ribosomal protein S5 [unclassified Methanosarcina]KKG16496.1 30S ribosomal protein S5 [Methanosarcina sp. 2.H.T.1A.15]KKG17501.1 30S ribosomal protein S5 [Methanosarcina sp. 2.H.T.1A.3]KKG23330.1 30S ribosomal protein S5 [Methanosarcina sp. 2.H.T.1A.6]KKG25906.1 30S ribosomal protein S5 [Methanosarcina sp. 2.H.T.1A.8]